MSNSIEKREFYRLRERLHRGETDLTDDEWEVLKAHDPNYYKILIHASNGDVWTITPY